MRSRLVLSAALFAGALTLGWFSSTANAQSVIIGGSVALPGPAYPPPAYAYSPPPVVSGYYVAPPYYYHHHHHGYPVYGSGVYAPYPARAYVAPAIVPSIGIGIRIR